MNEELIQKLVDQCLDKRERYGTTVEVLRSRKFAELIVRECCQVVERKYKYSNGTPVSFWEMSQDVQDLLKKHFGVEE